MIDFVVHHWASLPVYGKTIIVVLFLGLIYSVVKKLVKIAFMITILLVLVFMIRVLWDRISAP